MKRFFAALVLSSVAMFGAYPQARQAESKATEFNVTGCSPQGLLAEHVVISADGKSLDFNYYRDGDKAVKDDGPDHFVAQGQVSDPRPDGSRKLDAVGYLPDGQGGKTTLVLHGAILKDKIVIAVYIGDKLKYALYGYQGPVGDLVKLDQGEANLVCMLALEVGADDVPAFLNKWLHGDAAPAKDESKA